MEYIIEWSGSRRVVGKVEYYPKSLTVPFIPNIQLITADNGNQMELTVVGLSYIPWLDRYLVLFQGITETGDVLFFQYDNHVRGNHTQAVLTKITPGSSYGAVHKQFIQTMHYILNKGSND